MEMIKEVEKRIDLLSLDKNDRRLYLLGMVDFIKISRKIGSVADLEALIRWLIEEEKKSITASLDYVMFARMLTQSHLPFKTVPSKKTA